MPRISEFYGILIYTSETGLVPRQGVGQLTKDVGRTAGAVDCQNRLGGMLRYYYRQAA